MTDQPGSTTDRIAELPPRGSLEYEIAGLEAALREGARKGIKMPATESLLAQHRAELSRLRNEPASVEGRIAEINAAIKQIMDGALDALTNEEYIIIHNLQTERSRLQSAAPSPPSVEAGRDALESALKCFQAAWAEGLSDRLYEKNDVNEPGSLADLVERRLLPAQDYIERGLTYSAAPPPPDTLAIPNARQSAHARFNAELGNAGKSIPEEVLARAFNTAMSVYEKLRRGAPAGNGETREILFFASYCGDDNPDCSEEKPCPTCLGMSNVFRVNCSNAEYVRELAPEWNAAPPSNPDGLEMQLRRQMLDISEHAGAHLCRAEKAEAELAELKAAKPDGVREALEAAYNYAQRQSAPRWEHVPESLKTKWLSALTILPSRTGLEEAAEIVGTVKLGYNNPAKEPKVCICCPDFPSHVFTMWFEIPKYRTDDPKHFDRSLDRWLQSVFSFKQLEDRQIKITATLIPTRATNTTAPAAGDRDG